MPLCAEYLVQQKKDSLLINTISKLIETKFGRSGNYRSNLIYATGHISEQKTNGTFLSKKLLTELFSNKFLPGQTVTIVFKEKTVITPA